MNKIFAIVLLVGLISTCSAQVTLKLRDKSVLTGSISEWNKSYIKIDSTQVLMSKVLSAKFNSYNEADVSLYRSLRDNSVFLEFGERNIKKEKPEEDPVIVKQDIDPIEDKEVAYFDWKVRNNEVIWEHVFKAEATSENITDRLFRYLKTRSYLSDIEVLENHIEATMTDMQIDYKKLGVGLIGSKLIMDGKWDGKLIADVKDGRYRIILTGISVDAGKIGVYYGFGVSTQSDLGDTATNLFTNKSLTKFKEGQKENMGYFSTYLIDQLTIQSKKDFSNDF